MNTKNSLKQNALFLLAAAAAAITLAACGTNTAAPTAASQPVATVAPTTAQAPEAPPATAAPADTVQPTQAATQASQAPAAAPAAAQTTKFNLNTVTAEQILTIPNAGSRMVREFNEYRPYASVAQFRQEIGKYVGDAQVDEYLKYVYVPVAPNDADKVTLQQLPGVDAVIADKLIAARPYASKDAFIKKLTELTSADQANAAAALVEMQ